MALFIASKLEQTRYYLRSTASAGLPDDSRPVGLYRALAAVETAGNFFRTAAAGGVLQHLPFAHA
jgi:hypothetical protein